MSNKMLWKNLENHNFKHRYKISNKGDIKRLSYHKLLSDDSSYEVPESYLTPYESNGYLYVSIESKAYAVHKLVAEAFLKRPKGMDIVRHMDGNHLNNSSDNLTWTNRSEITKLVMKESNNRNIPPRYTGKLIYCKENDTLYPSIKEASMDTGLSTESISGSAYNNKSVRGYTFYFVEDK